MKSSIAATNSPDLVTWVENAQETDFPIQNLPMGVFSTSNGNKRVGVAIGHWVIDLAELAQLGVFQEIQFHAHKVFSAPTLNDFMACGRRVWEEVRVALSQVLQANSPTLQENSRARKKILIPMDKVQMHLPFQIGDYTDFYSSRQHAFNVGCMFRDPNNALLPNWLHIPVGYHGRASSVVVSGTPIHRPWGQIKGPNDEFPRFAPSNKLDFELEMAFAIGKENVLGWPVTTSESNDYIFGYLLFNDWSARDIQAWEYVPLGPFLGKNFASTVSPWVVSPMALEPFKVEGPAYEHPILPYLSTEGKHHYDVNLQVYLKPAESLEDHLICESNYKNLYWSSPQQLAHHTVNGCNLRVGDLLASGTISGEEPTSYGSLLELSWNGKNPLKLGEAERAFLQDGDTLTLKAYAQGPNYRIGFGECKGQVLPARSQAIWGV